VRFEIVRGDVALFIVVYGTVPTTLYLITYELADDTGSQVTTTELEDGTAAIFPGAGQDPPLLPARVVKLAGVDAALVPPEQMAYTLKS